MVTSSLTPPSVTRHWQTSTLVQTPLAQVSSRLQVVPHAPQWTRSLFRS
jgi:hypothetical protein